MTAGTSALLILIGGGVAAVAAVVEEPKAKPRIVTAVGDAAAAVAVPTGHDPASPGPTTGPPRVADPGGTTLPRTSDEADRTATRAPRRAGQSPAPVRAGVATAPAPAPATTTTGSSTATQPPAVPGAPVQTTRTETETREIPFATRLVRDPSLPRGTRQVQAAGQPGEERLRYLVTLADGQPTGRRLLDSTVVRQPQPRVIAFGTRRGRYGQPDGGPDGQPDGRPDLRPDRDCRRALNLCVPLGRGTECQPADARQEPWPAGGGQEPRPADGLPKTESAAPVAVLGQDLEPLDADRLDELTC
jgi:surface rod structure-forming protein G